MAHGMGTNEIVVLSGNTHPELADSITSRLGVKRTSITLYHAGNRETLVSLPESVRSKDVYIVQTATHTNVNDAIMELLLMGYTCRTSSANNIVGIMPYLPYGKQTRQRKRGSIPSKLVAKLIGRSGFTHIVTVDLHHKEIQGFFDIPVENLRASPFLISHIRQTLVESQLDRSQVVVVARHTSSVRKATAYAQRLRVDLAVLHGSIDPAEYADDGRSSPPPIRELEFVPGSGEDTLPLFTATDNYRAPLNLVGDTNGRLAIIVDDIIDDVEQFIVAGKFLKDCGAIAVHLVATHVLFSPESATKLADTEYIDEIVVTNTVPHEQQALVCPKIKTIDIGILLTEAIRRLHNHESLSYLFADVSMDD